MFEFNESFKVIRTKKEKQKKIFFNFLFIYRVSTYNVNFW